MVWTALGELQEDKDADMYRTVFMSSLAVLTVVVLTNLLVAMLTATYEKVHADADDNWKMLRAMNVVDYDRRAVLSDTPGLEKLVTNVFRRFFGGKANAVVRDPPCRRPSTTERREIMEQLLRQHSLGFTKALQQDLANAEDPNQKVKILQAANRQEVFMLVRARMRYLATRSQEGEEAEKVEGLEGGQEV